MKRYLKEIVLISLQALIFYILPLFAGPTDAMGLVLLLLISSWISGALMGILSKERVKFFYPLAVAAVFLPTVVIYYNFSALIHALWYFCVSLAGLVFGTVVKLIIKKIQ